MSNRNQQIDILKGIGIICVVLGHCQNVGQVGNFIYTFHMPLFFFCSGYLMTTAPKVDFKTYAIKKSKGIIKLYSMFFVLSAILMYILVRPIGNKYVQSLDWTPDVSVWLKSYLLSGRYLYDVPLMNFALWYLPLYLISILVYYYFRKYAFKDIHSTKTKVYIVSSMIVLLIITQPINRLLLYNGDDTKVCLSLQVLSPALYFMMLGSLVNILYHEEQYRTVIFKNRCVPLLLLLGIALNRFHSTQILNASKSYMIGASSIVLVLYIVTLSSKSSLLSYLGKHSLIVYGMHRPILYFIENSIISSILRQCNITGIFKDIFSTILVISILLVAEKLISKLKDSIKHNGTILERLS